MLDGRRKVQLLGPIGLESVDGDANTVPRGRGRSILALLALESPKAVAIERIVDAVWNHEPPASIDSSVHVAISRLRRAPGPETIITTSGGYRLGDLDVDVAVFRSSAAGGHLWVRGGDHELGADRFREALAVWRGEPLDGCDDLPFVQRARRALEEERMNAVIALVDCELASGRHDTVVGELTGLVDRFPYREGLWSRLMISLYRAGRQADALRAFVAFRSRLGQDLGLEPSADPGAASS